MLAQHRLIDDPESGGSFTVKRYKRITPIAPGEFRDKVVVHLVPENPDFRLIILETSPEDPVTFVAEFIQVIPEPQEQE